MWRRLREVAVIRAPVGEVNVAVRMRDERAPIGGEGNGGVILTEVHLGRDAPVGAALLLQLLHEENTAAVAYRCRAAAVRHREGQARPAERHLDTVYQALRAAFPDASADTQDGLRLSWPRSVGACAAVGDGTDRASDCRGTVRRGGAGARSAFADAARRVGRVTLTEGSSLCAELSDMSETRGERRS